MKRDNFYRAIFAVAGMISLGLYFWEVHLRDKRIGLLYISLLTLLLLGCFESLIKKISPLGQILAFAILISFSTTILGWSEIGVYRYILYFFIRWLFAILIVFFNKDWVIERNDFFNQKYALVGMFLYPIIIILAFLFKPTFFEYGGFLITFDTIIVWTMLKIFSKEESL